MSGTLPTTVAFRTIGLISVNRNFASKTHSGKRQVRKVGGHLWRFNLNYPVMKEADLRELYAFLMLQEGIFSTFTVIPPDLAVPKGIATGTPVVKGAGQTGSTLITDGWTANQTAILKAGDILNVAGNTKVYMATNSPNSDGTGTATVNIKPPMVTAYSDNAAITVNSVPFTVSLDTDLPEYNASFDTFFRLGFGVEEVLS